MWNLFLDDERDPVDPTHWVVCRSTDEAISQCLMRGEFPAEIAFDHDLGGDDTSMRFIRWMIDMHYDGDMHMTQPIRYTVHSQNPIGARNIQGIMEGWISSVIGRC
jgi:hypothetical protein